MKYTSTYHSPHGIITLAADEEGLTGLWFTDQKYFGLSLAEDHTDREIPVFIQTKQWLDQYFSGKEPDIRLPLKMVGTPFQKEVWKILLEIPYGTTITYNDIAKKIASQRGIARMSAQAVGSAVGKNRISIIIPCHRVIGSDGSLTGYAGGVSRKEQLLRLEGVSSGSFYVPKKGTAL